MQTNEFEKLILDHELLLAYCSTPTCNVCRVLKPRIQALISELPPWHDVYLNTTRSSEIAGQYLVFAVPTLILFVQGREVYRFSRYFSLNELARQLERYCSFLA